jgi:hypothetical protein
MAQMHNDINDVKTLITSLLLIATSFITNMASHLIENYEVYFKLLTLFSLSLVIFINAGKAFKMIYESIKQVIEFIKRVTGR